MIREEKRIESNDNSTLNKSKGSMKKKEVKKRKEVCNVKVKEVVQNESNPIEKGSKNEKETKKVHWIDSKMLYEENDDSEKVEEADSASTIKHSTLFSDEDLTNIEKNNVKVVEEDSEYELEDKLYPVQLSSDFVSSRVDDGYCDFDKSKVDFSNGDFDSIDNSTLKRNGCDTDEKNNSKTVISSNIENEKVRTDSMNNEDVVNERIEKCTNIECDNEGYTEEDWLNWFQKELCKGDEQIKAKTLKTEVKEMYDNKSKGTKNNYQEVNSVDYNPKWKTNVIKNPDCNVTEDLIMFIESDFMNMRVMGTLEGRSIPLLVDTGAGQAMISHQCWEELGRPKLQKIESSLRWSSASGHNIHVYGKATLEFELNERKIKFPFVVADNLNCNCILGINILYHMGIVINVRESKLSFIDRLEEIPVKIHSRDVDRNVFKIYNKRKLKLLPKERNIVRGSISSSQIEGKTVLIEPLDNDVEEIKVASCINVVRNNEVLYEVFNPTNEEVYLKNYEEMAKFSVIPDDIMEKYDKNDDKRVNNINNVHTIDKSSNEKEKIEEDEPFEVSFEKSNLNNEQKQKLIQTLSNFKDVFVSSSKAPGRTKLLKFEIDTADHKPVRNNPYRISQHESEIMEKEIDQYLKLGLIRPSQSPWSSPVLMIRKPDGGIRFCIDYRKLNNITIKDSYPLPRIDDLLDVLGGAKYFSSMDIASEYWNVPMKEESIPKTAFTCKFGLYEWVVMPFGLTNAPAAFQKLMDEVLRTLKWKICLVYLDDCVIFSQSFRSHIERLKTVLERFRAAGFRLKLKKCYWGRSSIPFLGHLITNQGILPNPAKVITVMKAKAPVDVSSLRSFTGLTSYFRRFIKGYANIVAPLERLKQKDVRWNWSDDCKEAFEILKRKLCQPPILAYPNWSISFEIHTDACVNAISAILCQKQNGRVRVISYAGRVTSKAEKKYGITELECLAAVYGVKKYRCYVEGRKFTLVTDHSALSWLFKSNSKSNNRRLMRWIIELQSYNFETKYRPGKQHGCADGISRILSIISFRENNRTNDLFTIQLRSGKSYGEEEKKKVKQENKNNKLLSNCTKNMKNSIETSTKKDSESKNLKEINLDFETTKICSEDIKELKTEQLKCTWMFPYIIYLKERALPTNIKVCRILKKNIHKFVLDRNGVLNRIIKISRRLRSENNSTISKQVICVPYEYCNEVLKKCHDDIYSGHLGRTKTWERIRERFYWPGMYEDVKRYVTSCEECMKFKGERNFKLGKRQRMPIESLIGPFDFIVADAIGPLPITKNRNRYIITITDYFTRWAEAVAVPDLKSSTWLRVL